MLDGVTPRSEDVKLIIRVIRTCGRLSNDHSLANFSESVQVKEF